MQKDTGGTFRSQNKQAHSNNSLVWRFNIKDIQKHLKHIYRRATCVRSGFFKLFFSHSHLGENLSCMTICKAAIVNTMSKSNPKKYVGFCRSSPAIPLRLSLLKLDCQIQVRDDIMNKTVMKGDLNQAKLRDKRPRLIHADPLALLFTAAFVQHNSIQSGVVQLYGLNNRSPPPPTSILNRLWRVKPTLIYYWYNYFLLIPLFNTTFNNRAGSSVMSLRDTDMGGSN